MFVFNPFKNHLGHTVQKNFISGKHYAYGVKVECTHAPNGQLMRFTSYYSRSVHNLKYSKKIAINIWIFLRNSDTFD